jgi:hypothetical protein
MELSFNYGTRSYTLSDNYIYALVFIVSLIIFKKQKQRRNRKRKILISPLNTKGGDNFVILQGLYDQCLSEDSYVQVTNSKVKQIIRKMLNIPANKPVIVSAAVYFMALLKTRYVPLVLQNKGTKLIVSNFGGFLSKSVGSALFAKLLIFGSTTLLVSAIPLILTVLVYSHLHIDCGAFVNTLPIIVAPYTDKPLSHEFDKTKVSSYTNLNSYVRDNCLGRESIQRKSNLKSTLYILLK